MIHGQGRDSMKNLSAAAAAVCSLLLLLIFPDSAKDAALGGLETCGEIIIPSLFPFFVAVNLISEMGIVARICEVTRSSISRAAFIIGISGGYPIGASYIAEARKRGEISCSEASDMLIYCNNSGPAFIISAVGISVFNSVAIGILLYASHILSALIYGKIFCRTSVSEAGCFSAGRSFADALVTSVKKSAAAIISICGFVLTFSVFLSVIDAKGLLHVLCGALSSAMHTELKFSKALIYGVFELGNSISQMQGLSTTPLSLALASFILGWGGISVHFQTFSIISDTDIKTARYVIGRFLIAIIGAVIAYLSALIFRI